MHCLHHSASESNKLVATSEVQTYDVMGRVGRRRRMREIDARSNRERCYVVGELAGGRRAASMNGT